MNSISNKYILIIIIVVVSFTVYVFFPKQTNNEDEYIEFKNDLLNLKSEYESLAYSVEGKKIDDFIIANEKNDTLKISSILTSNKLIYKFDELNCDSCIINEFNNLKSIFNTPEKINNLIIISEYNSLRNLYLFKRLNGLESYTIYNLLDKNSEVLSEMDELGIPYFLALNKNLEIKKSFIPIKNLNERTLSFLKKWN